MHVPRGDGTQGKGNGTRLPKETLDILNAIDFSGKTILVTGTTNGLGAAVSKQILVRKVDRLIMGVRNVSKGEELKTKLLSDSVVAAANPNGKIDVFELEMEDYKSVQAFATRVQETTPTLDVAVMNAGVGGLDYNVSKPTGHERMLQVDVLSNTYLAIKLIPLLEKTAAAKGAPSRLLMIGSWTQFSTSIAEKKLTHDVIKFLDDDANFDPRRYPDTQLLNGLVVNELGHRLDKSKVIVVEPTPPWTLTNWGINYPEDPARDAARKLMAEIGLPVDEASLTYIVAIVGDDDIHGEFLDDNMIAPRSPCSLSPDGQTLQKELWKELVEEFKKVDPTISTVSVI
ncbi:carbonyl reductase [Trichoderma arundinaceum]|uniref:Carbonyl reductase n=1 Tax=Trichoderma arundinaceum TaxID=490622 RepID=A0A395NRB8_TRIAR|nr:carbonyl reductase [Trichoderma arundinaceum]